MAEDCVEWAGTTFKQTGYGRRWFNGRDTTAHRAAFIEHHGREPVGVVRHKCDNRLCYNVGHLVEGSHADNMHDMRERDRSNRGERHPTHKLTADQVSVILKNKETRTRTQRSLAAEFGVSEQAVCDIVNGRNWSDERNFK
jgi:hypothetical protein